MEPLECMSESLGYLSWPNIQIPVLKIKPKLLDAIPEAPPVFIAKASSLFSLLLAFVHTVLPSWVLQTSRFQRDISSSIPPSLILG